MAAITWSRSFSVGIRKLDQQHRRIVTVLNQLYELDRARERELLASVFTQLRDYMLVHFHDEESLMHQREFPSAAEHQREHARFTETICDYHREFLAGHRIALINVYNVIWDWLVGHVLVEDRALGAWCRHVAGAGLPPVAVPTLPPEG